MAKEVRKGKEIYTYQAPWTIYALAWSYRADNPFRLAIGSFTEDYTNKVSILKRDQEKDEYVEIGSFDHPYPATKVMWIPDKTCSKPDLIGTTGDFLRIWKLNNDSNGRQAVKLKDTFNNNKNSECCAPLTSFDWNDTDSNIIGTSSIDTTCTIWDLEAQKVKAQLIAHDKEVFDMAFAPGRDVFASVGADGSVRMFDLRTLEHSTIIYESPKFVPLLRLAWNKQDPSYMATFLYDSSKTILIDIRAPSLPAAELGGHTASINAISWASHSSCHICTAADDQQALIWDLSCIPKPVKEPILQYEAQKEINSVSWSRLHPDWIACAFDSTLQTLRV